MTIVAICKLPSPSNVPLIRYPLIGLNMLDLRRHRKKVDWRVVELHVEGCSIGRNASLSLRRFVDAENVSEMRASEEISTNRLKTSKGIEVGRPPSDVTSLLMAASLGVACLN
jgi:hypothetical protein